ncbi:MAG: carboxypeptidase regulatory-like domain-containing protein, partial [Acidobacteria bacterium]|nr:carboxypeptidase regulatory-like domain-containing protein [Acidobacteriota bacterium]
MRQSATLLSLALLAACSPAPRRQEPSNAQPAYYKVDPATAALVTGTITWSGRRPAKKPVDMSEDPACVAAHKKGRFDGPVVINSNGTLANVFVYIKSGLEGRNFPAPSVPAVMDQNGCWFRPRVLGIQTGQQLSVTNSDPVTHNIHPLAHLNREWNHSQGQGDAPLARKFLKPEVMIRVKCNIHSWMRAWLGVVEHPYFAVSGDSGQFEIRNLPPGEYTLGAWHETL